MDPITGKVQKFIEKEELLREGDSVIIGLSGGSDSVCLLSIMKELAEVMSLKLTAVHVHHGIRGSEADRDEAFAGELCRVLGIDFRAFRYDIPRLSADAGIGEEEMGRNCRRETFSVVSEEIGADAVALAHNRNDLAETLLFNLARGAGLRGLSSMRPKNGKVIRPILCLEKKEILEYLSKKQIAYQTDSTNLSDLYTRNRIRRQILPSLEEHVNPRAGKHLADTAALLSVICDYMAGQGREAMERARQADGSFRLAVGEERLPDALLEETVLQILFELAGKQKDIGSRHVMSILELFEKQSAKQIDLPCRIVAVREYESVRIGLKREPENACPEIELKIPGRSRTPYGCFETKIFAYSGEKIETNRYTKWFDYGKINSGLLIRSRREKDYMIIGGGHRKKVRRIFADDRIPERKRMTLPLIAAGEEILWIPGGRRTDGLKITEETLNVLEIRYIPALEEDQEETRNE